MQDCIVVLQLAGALGIIWKPCDRYMTNMGLVEIRIHSSLCEAVEGSEEKILISYKADSISNCNARNGDTS